jgi:ubiquinone/menaquinone biosynthesis C-methylase UbiE
MRKEIVDKIISETEVGYDMMSQKFSETRTFFWRGLEFIKDYAGAGERILDFGCGNGRLLELLAEKSADYIGVDVSQKLIDLAVDKYKADNIKFQKISGSGSLAFPDNYFNTVYSIAVFHHLPKEHAKKIARELYRVTRSGGKIIVTVWNLWQKKYYINILENWLDKILGKSELDWNDCYITFKNNQGEVFQRYHHAFTKGELGKMFQKAGFKIEKCEKGHGRNIIFVGRK